MLFSERTAWNVEEIEYAAALHHARGERQLIDLAVSNPSRCGFAWSPEALLSPLQNPASLVYAPEPFGLLSAREAVSTYYRDHGALVPPEQICLTTSTSEAYGMLFQLLCDPGDEILIARPSYPLFQLLARLHDVTLREYPLFYDPAYRAGREGEASSGWFIDMVGLEEQLSERTRAVIVVHPNNPTGHFVADPERLALEQFCARHGLALIADEVFLDFALSGVCPQSFAAGENPVLTFVLSGISKVCALPQMKLSWLAAKGPTTDLITALARLDIIADTYLSLSAPAQLALPSWLRSRGEVQQAIGERLRSNLGLLDRRLGGSMATRLGLEGGWTVVVRVPREVNGQPFAFACLERGLIVQPGELYGLAPGRIVMSLLTPTDTWVEGLALLPVD